MHWKFVNRPMECDNINLKTEYKNVFFKFASVGSPFERVILPDSKILSE